MIVSLSSQSSVVQRVESRLTFCSSGDSMKGLVTVFLLLNELFYFCWCFIRSLLLWRLTDWLGEVSFVLSMSSSNIGDIGCVRCFFGDLLPCWVTLIGLINEPVNSVELCATRLVMVSLVCLPTLTFGRRRWGSSQVSGRAVYPYHRTRNFVTSFP